MPSFTLYCPSVSFTVSVDGERVNDALLSLHLMLRQSGLCMQTTNLCEFRVNEGEFRVNEGEFR